MLQQYYDYFYLANQSLQERLGTSGSTINRDSAIQGWQTRSLVQMLNYGRDAITAMAASHLLNMDVLNSNDAYLLRLSEGLLLNSIESITPPIIFKSNPFVFRSNREYGRWSSVGNIQLDDGTNVSLIVYDISIQASPSNGTTYFAAYCAGNYVRQEITEGFNGYTLGVFSPIYISETYKSVWTDSVEIVLTLSGQDSRKSLKPVWSMDELLALPDASDAVLCFHTPRGMTFILGDGELYGSGYNGKDVPVITGLVVSYVKCDSLAPVNNSTLTFNSDIIPTDDVPVLTPLNTGDTSNTLRTRSVAEFFAAGKITNATDLVTEVKKIPWVKSVYARQEYNWPLGETLKAIIDGKSSDDAGKHSAYVRHSYSPDVTYMPGMLVAYGDTFYICVGEKPVGTPDELNGWIKFMSFNDAQTLYQSASRFYPSACVLDNATIVMSGLVYASRQYWVEDGNYSIGDIVYHSDTDNLWLAVRSDGGMVAPGSETDIDLYSDDGTGRHWVNREEAQQLVSAGILNPQVMSGFMDYEAMTQSMFEAEFKGYFNIARKLGFTSVVVEPLIEYAVTLDVSYRCGAPVSDEVNRMISEYVCYEVGKDLRADDLNSLLTKKFNLSSVYISIYGSEPTGSSDLSHFQLPAGCYVPMYKLTLNITEKI